MENKCIWTCSACKGSPTFDHEEMMTHLREVHDIDPAKAKGTRTMLAHVDAADWFSWDYEWTIGDLVLKQSICSERNADDPFSRMHE